MSKSLELNHEHIELIARLQESLSVQGYAVATIKMYVRTCQHFLYWKNCLHNCSRMTFNDFVETFLFQHLPDCDCGFTSSKDSKTVRAAIHHLIPLWHGTTKQTPPSAIDIELRGFASHLKTICGLRESTCFQRLHITREFLLSQFGNETIEQSDLSSRNILAYVAKRARTCCPGTGQVLAVSIRSYLKYLVFRGLISTDLVGAVPSIPTFNRLATIPKILSPDQLLLFLQSFDRTGRKGMRDYAMALCMLDLGLRAGEVASLLLGDIDWQEGILRVKGMKTRRERLLPLTVAPGKAIAFYLQDGRLPTAEPFLFVRHSVPAGNGLTPEMVRGAMRRAYARSGFPKTLTGTHILRHTAATRMYQGGASLKEVADVLGHGSINTTMIYTKVDLPSLMTVALPWPEVRS